MGGFPVHRRPRLSRRAHPAGVERGLERLVVGSQLRPESRRHKSRADFNFRSYSGWLASSLFPAEDGLV